MKRINLVMDFSDIHQRKNIFMNRNNSIGWFCFLLLLISHTCYSQENEKKMLDSLHAVSDNPKLDTNKVNATIEIGRFYLEKGKFDSVKFFGHKSLQLSERLGDKKRIGIACYYIGYGEGAYGNYDSTNLYFARAEKIMLEIKDTLNLVSVYNAYSILNNFQSDYSTAISYLVKAEDILKNTNNAIYRRKQAEILSNLGLNLVAENQLDKGILYLKKALVLVELNEYISAPRYKVTLFNYLTEAYIAQKKYKEAKIYLDSATSAVALLKNQFIAALVLKTTASYYSMTDDPEKALAAYLEGLALTDSTHDIKVKAEIAAKIGNLYFDTNDYPAAENYAILATTLGKQLRLLKVTAEGYDVLKKIAVKRKDYKAAFQYAEFWKIYADSATNIESQKTTLTLEAKYQANKKGKEIAMLTLSNKEKELSVVKRNKWLLMGGIGATAIMLLLGLLYRNSKQKQALSLTKQKLQQGQIQFLEGQQQVVSLQSMLNGQETERTRIAKDLHDGLGGLFSTVKMHFSTLQHDMPALKENQLFEKSYELVDTAAVEVRRIAHNMMPEVLMKLGLIDGLKDMCNNINAGRLMNISLQAYGMHKRLSPATEIMLYRIIQELLNNIMKHAHASEAIVQFNQEGNRLMVTVEDNGRGFNINESNENKHAGLDSVESRVKYLHGKLSIESGKDLGTTVIMEFLINEA